MLVYHPAFDIYHTVFRMLKILSIYPDKEFRVDHLKLIDYFTVFPNELAKIKMPLQYKDYKKLIKMNKYENVPNGRIVFQQIQSYQDSALQAIVSYPFIDPDLFAKGVVKLIEMPKDLLPLINKESNDTLPLNVLEEVLLQMPYEGPIGLKDRSNLF